ncbi:L,D-transpeptidase family protein [Hydrocarboniphaga sp.]|uniref:L,D-transpeptidase family protein n=1 Tax=Hydrocarboniphaga sp. TaxID=2033016 RepID=UPI0026241242|nr:L,D-transpeptidase family protein [Hydrocarboniphaga sp.]
MPKTNPAIALLLAVVLALPAIASAEKADLVQVKKSKARLYLIKAGTPFADFPVVFGAQPEGHKQQEGDERTPEGRYVLDYKKENSAFFKSIHISYPNAEDSARAKQRGVGAGGAVMIHGQKNGLGWLSPVARFINWTDGCIALTNEDMQAVWEAVDAGTPIEIEP